MRWRRRRFQRARQRKRRLIEAAMSRGYKWLSELRRRSLVPRIAAQPSPRYDDVFYEGVAWLDTL